MTADPMVPDLEVAPENSEPPPHSAVIVPGGQAIVTPTRVRRRMVWGASDLAAAIGALLVMSTFGGMAPNTVLRRPPDVAVTILLIAVWVAAGTADEIGRKSFSRRASLIADLAALVPRAAVFSVSAFLLTSEAGMRPAEPLALTCLIASLTVCGRRVVSFLLSRLRGESERVVIVGAGDVGQLIADKLLRHPELGTRVVGFVDSDPKPLKPFVNSVPVLGMLADLAEIVEAHAANRVVLAFSGDPAHEVACVAAHGLPDTVQVDVVPRLFDVVGAGAELHDIEGLPLINVGITRPSFLAVMSKRAMISPLRSRR